MLRVFIGLSHLSIALCFKALLSGGSLRLSRFPARAGVGDDKEDRAQYGEVEWLTDNRKTIEDGVFRQPEISRKATNVEIGTRKIGTRNATRNLTVEIELTDEFSHVIEEGLRSASNNTNLLILRIALPVMGSLAFEPLVSLLDTWYIGQFLGSVPLSAYGIADRIFAVGFYVLNFLATSTTPIVANLRAKGEEEVARELVGRLLFFAMLGGLLLTPLLQSICFPLLTLFGAPAETYDEAATYFLVRSYGAPAATVMAAANGILRGYLDTTFPLVVTVVAFIVDYSADPEVVYPKDPTGLGASAAATVIAEWLSAGLFLTRFVTMRPPLLPLFDLFPPWREVAPVVKAGLQVFVRTVLLQGLLAVSCAAAARVGPLDLAAHAVALQLWLPPAFLMDGFGVAGQGLVADALGRKDRVRARDLSQRLLKWGLGVGGVLGLAYLAVGFNDPALLPSFFTEDGAIIDKVSGVLLIIALMQFVQGFVNVGAGILQGCLDFQYQVVTISVSSLVALLMFSVSHSYEEGLISVWQTLLTFQLIRAALYIYRFTDPNGPLGVTQAEPVGDG